jgi:hypothetical protein
MEVNRSGYVPVRMQAYTPSASTVVYLPPEYSGGTTTIQQHQQPQVIATTMNNNNNWTKGIPVSQLELDDWFRHHRRKPIWQKENRKTYPLKVYKVPDRWLTEQRDNFAYYNGGGAMSDQEYAAYVRQQQQLQPATDIQVNNYTTDGVQPETLQQQPQQYYNYPHHNQQQVRTIEEQRQPAADPSQQVEYKRTTTPTPVPAVDQQQQQLRPRSASSERGRPPQISVPPIRPATGANSRPDTPRSFVGSAASTPRSTRSTTSISSKKSLRRPTVDHSYVHVPIVKDEKPEPEEPVYEYDPTKKTEQLKKYELFIQTRKKIKNQQKRNDRVRNKMIDEYYQQQADTKQAEVLSDIDHMERYLPPEGKPAFFNYGWANQNPVSEDNRLKTFNINPRDVSDVAPHTVSRRERSHNYEGWKRHMKTTEAYKPMSYANKTFTHFDGRQTNSFVRKAADALHNAENIAQRSATDIVNRDDQTAMNSVPLTEANLRKQEQASRTLRRKMSEDSIQPVIQSQHQQQSQPIQQRAQQQQQPQYKVEHTTSRPVTHQHHQQQQQQQRQQDAYIPSKYDGTDTAALAQERGGITDSKAHIQPTVQFDSSIPPGSFYGEDGALYIPADTSVQQLDNSGKTVYQRFLPQPIAQLNPKFYKRLPPVYTNYIRAAGKVDPPTLTTADCFRYFE